MIEIIIEIVKLLYKLGTLLFKKIKDIFTRRKVSKELSTMLKEVLSPTLNTKTLRKRLEKIKEVTESLKDKTINNTIKKIEELITKIEVYEASKKPPTVPRSRKLRTDIMAAKKKVSALDGNLKVAKARVRKLEGDIKKAVVKEKSAAKKKAAPKKKVVAKKKVAPKKKKHAPKKAVARKATKGRR